MGGGRRRRGGRGGFEVGWEVFRFRCMHTTRLFFWLVLHYTHFFGSFWAGRGPENILWRLERQHLFWGCYKTHTEYRIQDTLLIIIFRRSGSASQVRGHVHQTSSHEASSGHADRAAESAILPRKVDRQGDAMRRDHRGGLSGDPLAGTLDKGVLKVRITVYTMHYCSWRNLRNT